jgi:hypothetical protein
MKMIRWINTNPGAPRDEAGYWTSAERRFSITPNYRHTVYPDSYTVEDVVQHTSAKKETVRDAKAWAEDVMAHEWKAEAGSRVA